MKESVVKTVDFLMSLLFVVVGLVGVMSISSGNVWIGIVILLGGWAGACLLSGLWFCLSSIREAAIESVKHNKETNKLLRELLAKENMFSNI